MGFVPPELVAPPPSSPAFSLPAPLRPVPGTPDVPSRIPGYRVHAVLGSGGMATVYLAERQSEVGKRRWCALKVPGVRAPGHAYEKMFLAEASVAAELDHPHVCGVFDFGAESGRLFMAMEYANGRSLLDVFRTRAGRLSGAREAWLIARVLADVCEGLQAIHQQSSADGPLNLVHRDISPDNILLTYDGFAKIIDLGLVKTEQRGDKTEPGFVKGKISYVAPELLGGETATSQADIWSLGVVAWEMLTGQRLFNEATDVATLRKVIDHQVLAPSDVAPGLPKGLDAVVMRALARDPKERYASAADFATELWAFLSNAERTAQHCDLSQWMAELFPGERQQIENWLQALRAPSTLAPPELPADAAVLSYPPKIKNLLRRIRSQSSASLRAMPLRRRALASVGVASVLGLLAVVSQLGWSRPSSATSLNRAECIAPHRATDPATAVSTLAPSDLVVQVERSTHSSDLILRIRPPQKGEVSLSQAGSDASTNRATN